MESYVLSCKYAEPQFPPCEEDYSNFSDPGGFYRGPPEPAAYGGGYPPTAYTPQHTGYLSSQDGEDHRAAAFRGYREEEEEEEAPGGGREAPGFPAADPRGGQGAWATCAKPAQVQRKAACAGREQPPIVVYPWMKKVHIAHGETFRALCLLLSAGSLSLLTLSLPSSPSLSF